MMAMREQQLELQMEKLRMKNQQLEQQMEDVVSGTWTSTTQLIEENDRLESQIRQLQRQLQRRMKQPPPINGSGESYLQDEQEALRHTRAQLGLVEYLEGEPDVMAALNRFKTLLTSSC
jgi:DNA repair exonuclease SbcCD ATPase subunit